MILGRRDGGLHQVAAFGGANQVALLLLGTAPQFAHIGHPGGIQQAETAVAQLHGADRVVELVGRYAVYPFAGHGHGGVGLESCRAEHRHQRRGLVLAHPAAVGEVHLGIVQREAFALAHRDAGIADVVGHPVRQHGDAVQLVLAAAHQLVHLLLHGRRGHERTVVFIHPIEPAALGLPVGTGGEQELALYVVVGPGACFALERHNVALGKGVERAALLVGGLALHLHLAVVGFVLQRLAVQDIQLVHLLLHRLLAPEGDDVVVMAPHGRHIACLVVGQLGKGGVKGTETVATHLGQHHLRLQQGIGIAFLVGPHLQLVARLHVAHLHHLLAGAPVNHTRRRHIVVHRGVAFAAGPYERVHRSTKVVHQHALYLAVGRQRVVVHLHRPPLGTAGGVNHPYLLVGHHVAQPRLLHIHPR